MNTEPTIIPPRRGNLMTKLVVLGALIIISWIATLFVWGVVQEREERSWEAANEISSQWSGPQVIAGPVVTIPTERLLTTERGEVWSKADTLVVYPTLLTYEANAATEVRARGIYETSVYEAALTVSGDFDVSAAARAVPTGVRVLWDQAALSFNVSDVRGVKDAVTIKWNGVAYPAESATRFNRYGAAGVHVALPLDPTAKGTVTASVPLRGSQSLSFIPLAATTVVTLESDWAAPKFEGQFLPSEHTITPEGFSATWEVTGYGSNLPAYEFVSGASTESPTVSFGVALHQTVDTYTLIDRATKYGILFIELTFLTFFLYETMTGLRIHPLQYLLVGAAIALFYLLLLSFAEVVGFVAAYVIATAATTTLIVAYAITVLKAALRALILGTLLLALYGYLYILLQLETYSLLFGSVFLFVALALVMFITRNIDWYSVSE